MSQFFIAQGPALDRVDYYFRRALSVFHSRCRLEPCDRLVRPGIAIAKFPSLLAEASPIAQNNSSWLCEVGTVFYRGRARHAALAELCRDLKAQDETFASPLEDVDGTFALAWGSRGSDEFYLATDRVGTLHVYTAQADGCVLVSTSSMVIAALLQPSWNVIGIREFVATGSVFSPGHTLFEGIAKLRGATVFRIGSGKLETVRKYWDLGTVMYDRTRNPGDVPKLASSLKSALAVIRANYHRPVLDLTGGFDSRNLVAAMLLVNHEFHTVVVGNPGETDVRIAGRIAAEFGLHHVQHTPELHDGKWWELAKDSLPLCDGELNVLLYAKVLDVHRRMAAAHDVSINGSYGEICRGLFWEILTPLGATGHFDERALARKRFVTDPQVPGLLAPEVETDLIDHFAAIIRLANQDFESRPNTVQMDNNSMTLYAPRWQGRIASATTRLWPCVAPFLWRGPLEMALGAPVSMRVRCRMGRRLIEYLSPRLAALPTSHGYPALPLRITTAHRFWSVPGRLAYRAIRPRLFNALRLNTGQSNPVKMLLDHAEVKELFVPDRMLTREFYRPAGLKQFIAAVEDPQFSHVEHFGRIITLELLAQAIRA